MLISYRPIDDDYNSFQERNLGHPPPERSWWIVAPCWLLLAALGGLAIAVLVKLTTIFFGAPNVMKEYDPNWSTMGLGLLTGLSTAFVFVLERLRTYYTRTSGTK